MKITPALKIKLFKVYEKAAKKNDDVAALFQLAFCYGTGFGIEKSEAKMIEWLITAADHGSLDAMLSLASCCQFKEIPRPPEIVFSWMLKAAEAGHKKSVFKFLMSRL